MRLWHVSLLGGICERGSTDQVRVACELCQRAPQPAAMQPRIVCVGGISFASVSRITPKFGARDASKYVDDDGTSDGNKARKVRFRNQRLINRNNE